MLSAVTPAHAADGFVYQGKPVHPDCIAQLTDISSNKKHPSISLVDCSNSKKSFHIENDYLTTRDEADAEQQEFTSYSVIGQQGNKFLLDTTSWTGGTGIFTSVIWLELNNDKLTVLDLLAGGDRCNGGTRKTGAWEYAVNDTPYDMLQRAIGTPLPVKAYDDLESSAASCVAQTIFRFNPATAKASFVEMRLNEESQPMDDYVKTIKYQLCFNELYNQLLQDGKTTLNQLQIDAFRNAFKKKCMR